MADFATAKLAKAEEQRLGLPDGFQKWSAFPFLGMNLDAARNAIDDKEFQWRENYLRIGEGYLRTIWDQGTALYTAPGSLTIISFFWYNIGTTQYVAVFLSDGSGIQVDTSGNQTTMGSAGTFYSTGAVLPACGQWGTQYLLIASNLGSNAYWAWDGSNLFTAGTIGPIVDLLSGGSGYTSAPTVTAFGGEGSGITATAQVANGSVTGVTITNPGSGYQIGDVVQFLFTGGGSNDGAELTAAITSGAVASVQVTNGGSGYNGGATVSYSGGGGSGAAATATTSGDVVVSVTVSTGGSGYTGTPTVTINAVSSGSGATALAILTAGKVTSVTVVHSGSGFTSTPTLSFSGGGGSGATATAVLSGGIIYSVTVTSGGSGYTGTPAVIVAPGANKAAAANAILMPYGVSGSAIETYSSRVWLTAPYAATGTQNGGTILYSAPESLSDFSSANGGGSYISNEPFLRQKYVNIRQSNGYLYPMGDSAVDVISNVQTGGSPTVTTFNYQNVDPQTSLAWRDTAQYYGLSVLFANPVGAFGLYGGSVRKISKKITRLFENALFPPTSGAVTPTGAVASIFTIKCYLINMTVLDPTTGTPNDPSTWTKRTIMVGWDETDWFPVSQSSTLTYIGTQIVASEYTAWGTDGKSVFPLFQSPSTAITKTLSSKLYGANTYPIIKIQDGVWVMADDLSTGKQGITMSVTIDTEYGSYVPDVPSFSFDGQPVAATAAAMNNGFYGATIGVTMKSTSPDYVVKHLVIGYENNWGGYGTPPTQE
ncbi:MAG: hypothetical protein KGL39_48570 [Patescibacteria group bacterium]|nr:hypothetical protein [Patescibacteria group bacterium]